MITTGNTILGELKFRTGADQTFFWEAPEPCTADALDLVIHLSGGDETVSITQVHDDLTVVGQSGQRVLTLDSAPSDVGGLQGEFGSAWLVTPKDGAFQVNIGRIDGTSVYLTEELPRSLSLGAAPANGILIFSVWSGALTSADITGTAERNVAWEIVYDASYGSAVPAHENKRVFGLLHIVPQPFDTGLTHHMMVRHVRALGEQVNRSAQGYEAAIHAGMEDLILRIRELLTEQSKHEDMIPAGQLLRPAHVAYAIAQIVMFSDTELADAMVVKAEALVDRALRQIFVDANEDGVVDDGEADTQLTGATSAYDMPRSVTSFNFPTAAYTTTQDI